ncbi:GNAT family N-acetyltransferase [Nocardia acidivorans]|uniref:GNAT family N-acetyltransferase n=1 Tax=Nocardia acidivorans TaxID=404580 RepID=UPI000AF709BB|nr:GNAT family N-acetyltransferase [Nocardia acidivorans]
MTAITDEYEIDTDTERIDVALVHHWLSTDAYWALGREQEVVERAVRGSLNFGVYDRAGNQVAYARVVTDLTTFAWLCDVYVDPRHRGAGLGLRLAAAVRNHLAHYKIKRIMLATHDAHALYAKIGFVPLPDPEKWMVLTE